MFIIAKLNVPINLFFLIIHLIIAETCFDIFASFTTLSSARVFLNVKLHIRSNWCVMLMLMPNWTSAILQAVLLLYKLATRVGNNLCHLYTCLFRSYRLRHRLFDYRIIWLILVNMLLVIVYIYIRCPATYSEPMPHWKIYFEQ